MSSLNELASLLFDGQAPGSPGEGALLLVPSPPLLRPEPTLPPESRAPSALRFDIDNLSIKEMPLPRPSSSGTASLWATRKEPLKSSVFMPNHMKASVRSSPREPRRPRQSPTASTHMGLPPADCVAEEDKELVEAVPADAPLPVAQCAAQPEATALVVEKPKETFTRTRTRPASKSSLTQLTGRIVKPERTSSELLKKEKELRKERAEYKRVQKELKEAEDTAFKDDEEEEKKNDPAPGGGKRVTNRDDRWARTRIHQCRRVLDELERRGFIFVTDDLRDMVDRIVQSAAWEVSSRQNLYTAPPESEDRVLTAGPCLWTVAAFQEALRRLLMHGKWEKETREDAERISFARLEDACMGMHDAMESRMIEVHADEAKEATKSRIEREQGVLRRIAVHSFGSSWKDRNAKLRSLHSLLVEAGDPGLHPNIIQMLPPQVLRYPKPLLGSLGAIRHRATARHHAFGTN